MWYLLGSVWMNKSRQRPSCIPGMLQSFKDSGLNFGCEMTLCINGNVAQCNISVNITGGHCRTINYYLIKYNKNTSLRNVIVLNIDIWFIEI